MDSKIDHGDILIQEGIKINEYDTSKDIYDNIFFFYEKKICMSKLLHKLFDNRIKYMMKFYIPTPEFEYFLLLIRICFDLGFLKDKHKCRLIELIPDVKNENNLFNYLNDMEKTHLLLMVRKFENLLVLILDTTNLKESNQIREN